MIGPNVITLGGGWPECDTTAKVISSKRRRRTTDDECTDNQNGSVSDVVVVKKKRGKRTLSETETEAKYDQRRSRSDFIATKNINNNLIINHNDNDCVIRDETVLIIDANFGCSKTSTTNSNVYQGSSNFSDSLSASENSATGSLNNVSPQTQQETADNPNLSWLLDFKVSSLFDPDGKEGNSQGIGEYYERVENVSVAPPSTYSSSSTNSAPPLSPEPLPTSTNTRMLKPPYTYTELIEQALLEKGQLTVSGIYYWMSEKFPFFKAHDERWKNSVRHNLSINPHFRKGMKASQGSGHFWTLSTQGAPPPNESWKKQIVNKSLIENQETEKSYMDEVATATASIAEPSQTRYSPPLSVTIPDSSPDPSLTRTAEEILSGVKKEVEVQYLSADTDFLNHITRSGLEENNLTEVSTSYLMNDLGSEVILSDSFFCDDLNFQCCELTTAQM